MNYRSLFILACGLATATTLAQNVIIGPPVRTDVGRGTFAANETSSASVGTHGNDIITSWNDWSESIGASEIIRCGVGLSSNAGATWADFTLRPPVANRSDVEGDPFTIYDNRTGNLWAGAISFAGNGGVYIARKNIGSNTFQPSVMIQAASGTDKIWGTAGPLPGNPNSTRLYVAYNFGVARSNDLGATWTSPVSIGSGLGFNPRVAPNGHVYVSFWDFSANTFRLRRSTDGGLTFAAAQTLLTRVGTWGTGDCPIIPGNFRVPAMPSIAVDPISGAAYCVSFDSGNLVGANRNADLFFQKSTDNGVTWSSPTPIFRDTTLSRDHFWPWVEVDRTGRIHVLYFSTEAQSQNDGTTASCFADAWYAYSDNGGTTWSRERLTPTTFNMMNDGLARSMAFYGDYLGVALGGQRAYPHYIASWPNADPDNYINVVINPFTAPTTANRYAGTLVSGSVDALCQTDSTRFVVRATPAASSSSPNAGVASSFVTGVTALTSLSVDVTGSVTANPANAIQQRIELLNVQTNAWEVVDTRAATAGDTQTVVNVTGNPARFFNASTRTIQGRVGWIKTGPTTSATWDGRLDRFHVVAR